VATTTASPSRRRRTGGNPPTGPGPAELAMALAARQLPDWLSLQTAAIEYPASAKTLRRRANEHRIPHYRINGRILFRRGDLDAFFEADRVPAITDTELRRGRPS